MIDTLTPDQETTSETGLNAESSTVNDIAISVRNVSKMYPLYAQPSDRLKQSLWYALPRVLRGKPRQFYREFWALRDLSFEIKKGEALGIIGQNGSGKSTLLQIIAGTLTPTAGEVQVKGRVAALLELGSGFNPEFSGRENVYLNGSILGFSQQEMDNLFDEIAAFADIGQFMDQPVKLYSSGMFVRLAFAVQACVEPDVLIVDEALAVGDIFFQQKCYRRLEALRERGTSIILVSHSMIDVEQFCQQALLLSYGNMVFKGKASETVKRYYLVEQEDHTMATTTHPEKLSSDQIIKRTVEKDYFWPDPEAFLDISGVSQVSNGWARCLGVAVCNDQGQPCLTFEQGETASFFYEFELLRDIEVPTGGLEMQNEKGVIVHGKSTLEYGSEVPIDLARGTRLRFHQDITLEIAVGEYTFNVGLGMLSRYDYECRALYSHPDLGTKFVRLCILPAAGRFAVVFRVNGKPVQLRHHGVANLGGNCQVFVIPTVSAESSNPKLATG